MTPKHCPETGSDDALERFAADAQGGDVSSLAMLLAALRPRVHGWLRRSRDVSPAELEDLLQQIMVKVYRGLPSYQPHRGRFVNWVFAVAHNEVSNHRRSHRAVSLLEPAELDRQRQERDQLAASEVGGELWQVLARDELGSWLDQLTEREAQVVVLRHVVDLSLKEVAALMRTSEDAVSQTQRRALVKLRAIARAGASEDADRGRGVRKHSCRSLPRSHGRQRLHVFTLRSNPAA